ncbi:hypothetical protein ACERK3_06795 [Phycisphaerales bacterium AB-hyl4]|uniref:DUF4175 domain-containing protein n=1 Tax=Natronomicrosphaera hydrolytica TaxID=3242702 RepID=A0ABV4U5C0_9BACT
MSRTLLTVDAAGGAADVSEPLTMLAKRRQVVSQRAAAVRLAWLGAAALLVVLVTDAALGLMGLTRLAVMGGLLGGVTAVAAAWWRRPSEPNAATRQRLARELDRQSTVSQDRLVNALLLSGDAADASHERDPFTQALARRGVQRGAAAMSELDIEAAVDRSAMRREAARLWAVAVAWVVVLAIQPGVVGVGLSRVAMPWADVPAFSLTRLTVVVEPTWPGGPGVGEDVEVQVTVGGVVPEGPPTVVEAGGGGSRGEARRWAMRSVGGDADDEAAAWRHTFRALDEPMRFRVEAGAARSRWMVIRPEASEPVADAAEEARPGDDDAEQPAEDGAADEAALAEHLAALRALMHEASALRDLAEAMASARGLDAATSQAMRDAMDEQLGTFVDDAAALAEAVAALAAEVDEPLRGALLALAERLGEPALAEVAVGGVMDGDDRLAELQAAAEADRAALAAHGQGLSERAEGTLQMDGDAEPATVWADPAARGTYDVTIDSADDEQAAMRAMTEQAPRAYRSLVERYFRALNEERSR